jgi:hypothetical protein
MDCLTELPTLLSAPQLQRQLRNQRSILPEPLTRPSSDSRHRVLHALAGPDCSMLRPPRWRPRTRRPWRR